MTAFTIKQERFEGPLDLLLTLIERRQLHIGDVVLSKVTDDFIGYVKSFVEFPIAESAQFAYIASTLLLIKSKSLLPQLSLSREEEESIEDLQKRLKLLQRFRNLSRHVRTRFGESPMFLPLDRKVVPVFAPPKDVSASNLLAAVKAVLSAIPKMETLAKVAVKKGISLEQMIESLKERVTSALRMSFKEFAGLPVRGTQTGAHKAERVHPNGFFDEKSARVHPNGFFDEKSARVNVIVGFLAMLELVKDGLINVTQDKPHGDIMMETGEVSTPRY